MKKIIIIGASGAGKTTLARHLSEKLNIPHTELDSINHQENWRPIEKEEFRSRVDEITKQDGWILCGNYFSTLGLSLWRKADTIIWCDYSFPLVMNRLLRRTLKRTYTKEVLWNGNRESFVGNFFTRDSVIYWTMRKWNRNKKRFSAIFAKPEDLPGVTLVRLRNPKETALFVKKAS